MTPKKPPTRRSYMFYEIKKRLSCVQDEGVVSDMAARRNHCSNKLDFPRTLFSRLSQRCLAPLLTCSCTFFTTLDSTPRCPLSCQKVFQILLYSAQGKKPCLQTNTGANRATVRPTQSQSPAASFHSTENTISPPPLFFSCQHILVSTKPLAR